MNNAESALLRLLEGNRRFVEGKSIHPNGSPVRRGELTQGQNPFACVLGCSDSRVPPEIIFDCGLGDLFVFRTAGHVVDMAVAGSIAYSVDVLGIPLLMVLGHTGCGAVKAAIDAGQGALSLGSELDRLVDRVRPAADLAAVIDGDLWTNAVRLNVEHTVDQIRTTQPFSQAADGRLQIVGGIYDLGSGVVKRIC